MYICVRLFTPYFSFMDENVATKGKPVVDDVHFIRRLVF